ncbi:MAG TPA: hypothetical protein VIK91_07790 [Nannocystis sp.]
MPLPYLAPRANPAALLLLLAAACTFDGSAPATAGAATTSTGGSSTGDTTTTTGAPTTITPTSMGPDGSGSESGTTMPVDPTSPTTSTGPGTTTTTTTDPGTSTSTSTGDSTTTSTTSTSTSTSGETTGDSTTDDSTTTGSSSTTEDASSSASSTTGDEEMCLDPDPEPGNNMQNMAVAAPNAGCNDQQSKKLSGVLNGAADIDWFRFHGDCNNLITNPSIELSLTADGSLRMCAFVDCDQGDPEFDCPQGTMGANSPMGNHPGCCGMGSFTISNMNCSGTSNESATVFLRFDQAQEDACVSYSLNYKY